MKKFLSILLVLTLAFALASCNLFSGNTGDEGPGTDNGENNGETGENNNDQNNNEDEKDDGVMTYAEYVAAAVESEVVIEAYVQATQSWWSDKITVYAADKDGAYFIYELACSEADAAKLTAGTKIKVTGYKAEWSGEVEIVDATFTFVENADTYVAPAKDLTSKLGTDELINYQNQLAAFKGVTVKSISYKNGEPGDDIYVTVTYNGADYDFCVERYLTGPETDVYKAFAEIEAGDVVDIEGFVYWYNGINTHITKVTVK